MAELHIHSMERCYLECVISIDMHIAFVRSIISRVHLFDAMNKLMNNDIHYHVNCSNRHH